MCVLSSFGLTLLRLVLEHSMDAIAEVTLKKDEANAIEASKLIQGGREDGIK